jgi:hypothetical protein
MMNQTKEQQNEAQHSPFYGAQRKSNKAHSIYADREKDVFVDSQTDMNTVMKRDLRRDKSGRAT